MGDEIKRYRKNETKHLRRRQRGTLFTIDDAFEEHHPELSNNQEIADWELRDRSTRWKKLPKSRVLDHSLSGILYRLQRKMQKNIARDLKKARSQFIQVKGFFDALRAP